VIGAGRRHQRDRGNVGGLHRHGERRRGRRA
jgi:hypothetical protein